MLLCCALAVSACATLPGQADKTGKVQTGPDGKPLREIPPQAMTLFEQATASMAAGNSMDAELRLQEFLLHYPNYPGAHVNLAILTAARGDDATAETILQDALAVDPAYPPALNQLGMLHRRMGRFPEAEAAYLRALDADPNYALAHYNLGVLNELYLQRLGAALQHFEAYQAISGEDKQVTKWIADLKRRIERHQRTANVTE
ncbi:MAG: tetratricopeptide repeat protein [Gammaproteobacteria bacterium]|nr:tetratricopeptide repeat protein [Gammaproteobacteria bacterium]